VIGNPGYETAEPSTAQPGVAANWTSQSAASLEETAEFAGDSGYTLGGYELFAHGWGSVDPQILLSDLIDALVEKLPLESFERDWAQLHGAQDQGFMFLTSLESNSFAPGTQTTESFETGWGSPLLLDGRMMSTARATFSAGTLESFDTGWGSTEFAIISTESALFDASGLSVSFAFLTTFEGFNYRGQQRVLPDITANTLTAVSPPLAMVHGDAVTLLPVGGDLPAPLLVNTSYIVSVVTGNAFTLVPFVGAPTVDITSNGTGAVYVVADPGRFWLVELS
jgi:hypothetical protein